MDCQECKNTGLSRVEGFQFGIQYKLWVAIAGVLLVLVVAGIIGLIVWVNRAKK